MIFFGIKSLFTNLPLEETIDIILNKICDEKKIKKQKKKQKKNMKKTFLEI